MPLIRGLVRLSERCSRFLVGVENVGFVDSLRLFLAPRSTPPRETSTFITSIGARLHHRGRADIGVVSHFWRPGYRIVDTPSDRVRFIVDAGANIGDETLRFRFFHPGASIVAIEPDADNYRLLQMNVGGDANIVALQAGLWPDDVPLGVRPGDTNEGFSVAPAAAAIDSRAVVQGVSIESILKTYQRDGIDILKLDIEGAEFDLFVNRRSEWIRKVKVFIVECPDNDRPGTAMAMFEALSSLGFNCFICGENLVLIRRDTPWKLETVVYYDKGSGA